MLVFGGPESLFEISLLNAVFRELLRSRPVRLQVLSSYVFPHSQRLEVDRNLEPLRIRPGIIGIVFRQLVADGGVILGFERGLGLRNLLINFLYKSIRGLKFGEQLSAVKFQFEQL